MKYNVRILITMYGQSACELSCPPTYVALYLKEASANDAVFGSENT